MIEIPEKLLLLMLHNFYQYVGGEDVSMATEIAILREAGHHVELLEWHNDSIRNLSKPGELRLFWQTAWNNNAHKQVQTFLKDNRVDLLHVQNFFPLASPAVHKAAHDFDIPTVQHLRNFRLGCLNSYLYRNDQVCELCVGRNPWRGVRYRCYRNSLPASLSVWQMITFHRWRRTWWRDVDAFVTPSQFAADKLIEIGMPADRLYVKPNFVKDPLGNSTIPPLPDCPTFMFAGRLSSEKGLLSLLESWRQVNKPEWQLLILGIGPQLEILMTFCRDYGLENVKFKGHQSTEKVLKFMQQSTALVMPSHWYETFGRIVIEAFACGRAAIVSNLGALRELVIEAETGFLVPYDDKAAWAERLRWCGEHPQEITMMGQRARASYLARYTPTNNYQCLMAIYQKVLNG